MHRLRAPRQCSRWFAALALGLLCLGSAPSPRLLAAEKKVKTSTIPTTTTLKASATAIKGGQVLTFTITVAPAKAPGTVTLYFRQSPTQSFYAIGTRTLVNGMLKAGGKFPDEVTGTCGFKAVYGGSTGYAASTSNIATVVISD